MNANNMRAASLFVAQHFQMERLQDPVVELLDAAYRGVVAALPASNVLPGWRGGSTDGLRSNYWCEGSFARVTNMVTNGVKPDTIPDRMILLNKAFFPLSVGFSLAWHSCPWTQPTRITTTSWLGPPSRSLLASSGWTEG